MSVAHKNKKHENKHKLHAYNIRSQQLLEGDWTLLTVGQLCHVFTNYNLQKK